MNGSPNHRCLIGCHGALHGLVGLHGSIGWKSKGSNGFFSRLDWAACRMWTWTIDSVLILDDLPNL